MSVWITNVSVMYATDAAPANTPSIVCSNAVSPSSLVFISTGTAKLEVDLPGVKGRVIF